MIPQWFGSQARPIAWVSLFIYLSSQCFLFCPKLLEAHGPVVRPGSFCTFPGRWEDPVPSFPVLFFRLVQGLRPVL